MTNPIDKIDQFLLNDLDEYINHIASSAMVQEDLDLMDNLIDFAEQASPHGYLAVKEEVIVDHILNNLGEFGIYPHTYPTAVRDAIDWHEVARNITDTLTIVSYDTKEYYIV